LRHWRARWTSVNFLPDYLDDLLNGAWAGSTVQVRLYGLVFGSKGAACPTPSLTLSRRRDGTCWIVSTPTSPSWMTFSSRKTTCSGLPCSMAELVPQGNPACGGTGRGIPQGARGPQAGEDSVTESW